MEKKKFVEKLNQYGGFHDSKVKQIYIETNHRIVGIVIDHAYGDVPSDRGEVIVPGEKARVPQRYEILYRPMTVLFKEVAQVIIRPEADPINEEIILSCELVEDNQEKPPKADLFHVKIMLSSVSWLDIFCKDFECKIH